tara:strand:- start:1471 stop:1854 length:384 start_codon:yes stop_codon:yes gene_type:complete
MKTIIVDAINSFVINEEGIFEKMYKMLECYPNKKNILTGANDQQIIDFGLNKMPYEVFTLRHNPEKTDPTYYTTMLDYFNIKVKDVIYFEHNKDAIKSAKFVGINTFYYDKDKKDLVSLKDFIDRNL